VRELVDQWVVLGRCYKSLLVQCVIRRRLKRVGPRGEGLHRIELRLVSVCSLLLLLVSILHEGFLIVGVSIVGLLLLLLPVDVVVHFTI
jgi:hypothetical protein